MLIPLGLVPICATVLLRRWLANEGFEDPDDDDDDDEFDWHPPADPRGGQHATPAPVETPAKRGIVVPCPAMTDDPSRIDEASLQRALAAQLTQDFGACVPGLPRLKDAELDSLVDTIRRNP